MAKTTRKGAMPNHPIADGKEPFEDPLPRKKWSTYIITRFYSESAGRCNICGKSVLENLFTGNKLNLGNICHIKAHAKNGPRFDAHADKEYVSSPDNMILLCRDCHGTIDNNVKEYPTDKLHRIKDDHIHKVALVASMPQNRQRRVVSLLCPIGKIMADRLDEDKQRDALINSGWYPSSERFIHITLPRLIDDSEKDDSFWAESEAAIESVYKRNIADTASFQKLAVFALAPIPLMVKLGTLVSDFSDVFVFNKFRDPEQEWKWHDDSETELKFEVLTPDFIPCCSCKKILAVSVTSDIRSRIETEHEGQDIAIWELRIPEPKYEAIKTHSELERFRMKLLEVLDAMSKTDGDIHIYMAIPNSAAVMLGMCLRHKAHKSAIIYDYISSQNKDVKALKIEAL